MNSDTELTIREFAEELGITDAGDDTSMLYAQVTNAWRAGNRAFRGFSSAKELHHVVAEVLKQL